MLIPISEKVKNIARSIIAEMADTDQFVYTNPGNDYPSDITYDTWPGEPSNKENEPASKKDDEKKKWDYHYIGPGPIDDDALDKGQKPTFFEDPESPKTDEQCRVQDNVKSKGVEDPDDLNRETWVGEGIIDSFSF